MVTAEHRESDARMLVDCSAQEETRFLDGSNRCGVVGRDDIPERTVRLCVLRNNGADRVNGQPASALALSRFHHADLQITRGHEREAEVARMYAGVVNDRLATPDQV